MPSNNGPVDAARLRSCAFPSASLNSPSGNGARSPCSIVIYLSRGHHRYERDAETSLKAATAYHPGRSDAGRNWNDPIQRRDDISFKITEIFQPGRNPDEIAAWPGPDKGACVA